MASFSDGRTVPVPGDIRVLLSGKPAPAIPEDAIFTGPYFRRDSTGGNSAETATVTYDCVDSHLALTSDANFGYIGGTVYSSLHPTGNVLSESDAGIMAQINNIPSGQLFNVQPFISSTTAQGGVMGTADHIKCSTSVPNPTVSLVFYTSNYGSNEALLNLTATGSFIENVTSSTVSVEALNWTQSCTFCTVKRVTSIGTAKGQTEPDGSYNSVDMIGTPSPTFNWSNVERGPNLANLSLWTKTTSTTVPANCPHVILTTAGLASDADQIGINETTSC